VRVLTIIPDEQLHRELAELVNIPNLQLVRSFTTFPSLEDLLRTIRVQSPDFLIVYVGDLQRIETLLESMNELMPGLPIVGLAKQISQELAHKLMQLGVREYLVPPITDATLLKLVDFLRRYANKFPKTHHLVGCP
jgi:response regulator of citrate/malate metabolism